MDGFTDLEEKIMVLLVKKRKTAFETLSDAQEIAGLLKAEKDSLELQVGALRELLEHEVRGCHPCGSDCVPGGVGACTGCDDRYKAVYSVLGKTEQKSVPMTICGYCGDPHPLGQSRPCRGGTQ